jgi:lyso-ornithine lipid O-acyltransferase
VVRRRVKATARAALFLALTLPLMLVQWMLLGLWPGMARRLPHAYHRLLARILGFQVLVSGAAPPAGGALLVSNHVSWIDIVALSAVMPLAFVAKREVAGWPLFGWMARLQNTLFIDRARRHSTAASNASLAERLAAGDRLVLFPEGTSHDGVSVLPFKSSFFAAATAPGVPVIPVTLAYVGVRGLPLTGRQLPRFAWYGDMELLPHLWQVLSDGPLTIHVVFHDPLAAAIAADRKAACAASEAAVRHGLVAARRVLR